MSDHALQMSTEINALAEALVRAQSEIKAATKDRENPFFGSRYATLDAVWDACRAPLTSHGLAVIQGVSTEGDLVTVTTLLLHTSGQWTKSALSLTPKDASPQAAGSAITYAQRYGLKAMVGVTAEEDDDGNAAQPAAGKAPRARQRPVEATSPAVAEEPPFHYETPPEGPIADPRTLFAAGSKRCPSCGQASTIIKGKPEFGGGWVCWTRDGKGCGTKWSDQASPVAPTLSLPAAEPEEDRTFMLGAVIRKVKALAFTAPERQALKDGLLHGHTAETAALADLRQLYLLLNDAQAVTDWRREHAA